MSQLDRNQVYIRDQLTIWLSHRLNHLTGGSHCSDS